MASLKIFFGLRSRISSTRITSTQTRKSAAIVSSFTVEMTSFEKMIIRAIGRSGKTAYQTGTDGTSFAWT